MPSPRFKSQVLEVPPAAPEVARAHFAGKLALETDPSDLHFDLTHGVEGLVVVDARGTDAYADRHVPGALNLPYPTLSPETVAPFKGKTVVVYCWSASCNAGTKAAARLAALGVPVKELLGGLAAWEEEGYPTEGALDPAVAFQDYLRYHHRDPRGPMSARGPEGQPRR